MSTTGPTSISTATGSSTTSTSPSFALASGCRCREDVRPQSNGITHRSERTRPSKLGLADPNRLPASIELEVRVSPQDQPQQGRPVVAPDDGAAAVDTQRYESRLLDLE